jgi:hypothetical protein
MTPEIFTETYENDTETGASISTKKAQKGSRPVLVGWIYPCTEPDNPTGAALFYHLPQDGCSLPWETPSVFCNPPYGEARDRWVKRAVSEGARRKVVLLIPAHTETKIFQEALAACRSVLFVRARLRFGVLRENRRQEAASHGSAIFGFGVCVSPLSALGEVKS